MSFPPGYNATNVSQEHNLPQYRLHTVLPAQPITTVSPIPAVVIRRAGMCHWYSAVPH
jgi:hypothetical protein